jgi:hypothetical protein
MRLLARGRLVFLGRFGLGRFGFLLPCSSLSAACRAPTFQLHDVARISSAIGFCVAVAGALPLAIRTTSVGVALCLGKLPNVRRELRRRASKRRRLDAQLLVLLVGSRGLNRRGIPQGSPISPLLANLYMRRFVLGWKMLGLEQSLGSRIVTYADDLVILCRKGKAEEALLHLRAVMGKLKLTVNEEKTRIRERR